MAVGFQTLPSACYSIAIPIVTAVITEDNNIYVDAAVSDNPCGGARAALGRVFGRQRGQPCAVLGALFVNPARPRPAHPAPPPAHAPLPPAYKFKIIIASDAVATRQPKLHDGRITFDCN
ncbi:hypothetical protein EVAR_51648_1 [Eumeta japonica]|uniref:Uncharacterized protein n=1 Tax=Eumeta variegata TaxID=151549 RepID=A0A4C1YHX9_EUMVA|nr:hypothetical protein EVAR_51648_1 [Eumeta japonica]